MRLAYSGRFFWFSLFFYINIVFAENDYIFELSTPVSTFINSIDNNIKVRHVYDSDVLNGFSVEFKSNAEAKQFITAQRSHILHSWPILHHSRAKPLFNNKNNVSTFFKPQDKNTLQELTRANYAYKELGVDGSGIKVGVVDSGVDYTHPALGGCFGKGCKVAYGYDLVGNNYNGTTDTLKPSHDPLDNCPTNSTSATGHGTFLSGIIAAQDKEYNWTGVAPGVTLGMWRVFSCNYGTVPNDILLKGIEMAYKAGMDVINLSLGLSGGWEEEALGVMVNRIVEKGVHVVASNGNIGPSGIFLPSAPAIGKGVIAVGSVNNDRVPGYEMKVFSKDTISIPYRTYTNTPLTLSSKLRIVSASETFNKENDTCKSFKGSKFNNSIVLIHQGGCDELLQIKHAKNAGAKVVVFYSDLTNTTAETSTLTLAVLPVVFINNEQGHRLFRAIQQEKKVQAQLTNSLVAMEAPAIDLLHAVSGFSSDGPTNELQLKPEIVAVGGNVFSTLPKYLKHYGISSGTSFSAPFVSGQIALLLSKRKMQPEETKGVLMNFATQVRPPISASQSGDSPIRQGAGKIDVVRAVHGLDVFHASPSFLGLNDSSHFNPTQEITFYNHENKTITLDLSHLPSLTALGYSSETDFTPSEPVTLVSANHSTATVHFSNRQVKIPANQSVKVTLRIQPPTHKFDHASHALYSGYIKACTGKTSITVPYLGMIGNMKDLQVLDHRKTPNPLGYPFPSLGLPTGNVILKPNETGHFVIQHRNGTATGGPYILTRLLTGTRILQIQILKKSKVVGDVPLSNQGSPRTYMMRNTLAYTDYTEPFYSWQWNGDYVPRDVTKRGTNGGHEPKLLKKGYYQLKVRALKVFGNLNKEQDWEEWTSPKFMLQ